MTHPGSDLDLRALAVRCPVCNSKPQTVCYNIMGQEMPAPHLARVDAYLRSVGNLPPLDAGTEAMDQLRRVTVERDQLVRALSRAVPLLERLGDFIGNAENRTEVVGDAKQLLFDLTGDHYGRP